MVYTFMFTSPELENQPTLPLQNTTESFIFAVSALQLLFRKFYKTLKKEYLRVTWMHLQS